MHNFLQATRWWPRPSVDRSDVRPDHPCCLVLVHRSGNACSLVLLHRSGNACSLVLVHGSGNECSLVLVHRSGSPRSVVLVRRSGNPCSVVLVRRSGSPRCAVLHDAQIDNAGELQCGVGATMQRSNNIVMWCWCPYVINPDNKLKQFGVHVILAVWCWWRYQMHLNTIIYLNIIFSFRATSVYFYYCKTHAWDRNTKKIYSGLMLIPPSTASRDMW